VVKLVDTPASGVGDASREGSSPFLGTTDSIKPKSLQKNNLNTQQTLLIKYLHTDFLVFEN
jgi:hypothetical protein